MRRPNKRCGGGSGDRDSREVWRWRWKIYDGDSAVMNGEKMRLKIYCISLSRLICCKSSFFIASKLWNGLFPPMFFFCSNFAMNFVSGFLYASIYAHNNT